jgi:acetyl-CoA acetyltransferase
MLRLKALSALPITNGARDMLSTPPAIISCNVARMALLLAGLPESVPGSTINRLCGSSLDAIGGIQPRVTLQQRFQRQRREVVGAHRRQSTTKTAKGPGLDPSRIDDVILGCANQAGEDNRNVARMALLLAGPARIVARVPPKRPKGVRTASQINA